MESKPDDDDPKKKTFTDEELDMVWKRYSLNLQPDHAHDMTIDPTGSAYCTRKGCKLYYGFSKVQEILSAYANNGEPRNG